MSKICKSYKEALIQGLYASGHDFQLQKALDGGIIRCDEENCQHWETKQDSDWEEGTFTYGRCGLGGDWVKN